MDKETVEMLFHQAIDLAYQHFKDPTDDHIETVFDRLALNYKWGIGNDGCVTIH